MPMLTVAGTSREIDLIVFDKDGTLVNFDLLWAGKLVHAVEAVLEMAPARQGLRSQLFKTLGIHETGMKVIPESPLAVSTLAKLGVATTVVLYQNGMPWHDAEKLARDVFMPAIEILPRASDIAAIGDVAGLIGKLATSGFRLAIFTSDDRNATEACLALLGIEDQIEAMVCGDDAMPGKPSGAGLVHLAQRFTIDPGRTLMIGDSVTDMRAGLDANVGWRLGVLSGTGRQDDLIGAADMVVKDIHALDPDAAPVSGG